MPKSKHSNHHKAPNNINQIRDIVQNTKENLAEAEISKEFADDPIQLVQISEENKRRKQSIEQLSDVIKNEVTKNKKGNT